MLSERHADAVLVRAPAKVNLYLEIRAKRPDGYHELETLMVAVSLYDDLEFKEDTTGTIHLECDQPVLSTGPDNLVVRAAAVLRARTSRGAAIRLTKRIPLAAGLAGGSTDAAATLAGLNRLWDLGLPDGELARLGAELGSDVPFFFATPAAWCTGRGEQVTPLDPGRTLWFVLVCPAVGLSTAEVYRNVRVPERPRDGSALRDAFARGDVEAIGGLLHNRLEEPAFRLRPELVPLLDRLRDLGPAGQAMSGSGTSLFALCRHEEEARRVAGAVRDGFEEGTPPRVYVVHSCL